MTAAATTADRAVSAAAAPGWTAAGTWPAAVLPPSGTAAVQLVGYD